MDPRMRMALRRSWHRAYDKLKNNQACAALFTSLGLRFDGIFALCNSVYHDGVGTNACKGNVEASTNKDSYQVYLCSPFLNPSYPGANTLIHEALHTAGLGEYPVDPDGMTPSEIDEMVRQACGP